MNPPHIKIFLLCFLFAIKLKADIHGTVLDTNSTPVLGATVSSDCFSNTTTTDQSGFFSLSANTPTQDRSSSLYNLNHYPMQAVLYSLTGDRLASANIRSPKDWNTFSSHSKNLNTTKGLQLLSIHSNNQTFIFKTLPLSTFPIPKFITPEPLKKKTSQPECSLEIRADGLLPKFFDINYNGPDTSIGSIVMEKRHISNVGLGYAETSVNSTIFRYNALTTFDNTQYIAYYDGQSRVVLGKRALGSDNWTTQITPFSGNTTDAHNVISIAVDGNGYLHISWDHHGHPLRYARSISPGSLELTGMQPMNSEFEGNVTYPEFHNLPNGDLLFLYRDGSSGNGDLMLKRYDVREGTWLTVASRFISGEGQRNAYWQFTTDSKGYYHVSWVWRETSNVASNHDLGYAVSKDDGITWEKTNGDRYNLPIIASNTEYAWLIPQNSNMINSTSMAIDTAGNPVICNYWQLQNSNVPQFHIVYFDGQSWQRSQVTQRTTPFSLSGGGTVYPPVSRPKIFIDPQTNTHYMLYRDEERGSLITVAYSQDRNNWTFEDLSPEDVGSLEPNYDPQVLQSEGVLHIFLQFMGDAGDGAGGNIGPQMVSVLEWAP